MKTHTEAFKENVKLFGREIDSIITYTINGTPTELGNNYLNSVSPHYEGGILKSVMKQLDIDSNVDIPLNTILNAQFGVKVNGAYEYINFGDYIVYKSEKQEDTRSYLITCYDKMLYSMKDYESLGITYPITVRSYISAICTHLGLTFANANDTFANYNRQIQNELYLDSEGNSLGYTFRDVLDELAQVTASTICINNNDELEIRYITNTNDTIDESFLKDVNVNFGDKFGPVNTIVLSRSAGADNIYYPSVLPDNPYEIKISDNQIMNGNNRSDYLPDIYNKLNGLEYYINNYSSTGITYYDLCDRYNVQIGENTYSCVMFNNEINITQGLEENIYTDMPQETVTDYTKADKTDRRINQTYLIVDKQNGIIQSLVDTVLPVSGEKTGVGTITLENAYSGQLYKLSIKGQMSLLFPQSESNLYGYALAPSEDLTPSNSLTPSTPVPYGNEISYPSNNLFAKDSILTIDDTEYKLDINFLNYIDNNVCDEFVYNNGTCYIIRRVGIDSSGNKYALEKEIIESKKDVILNVSYNSTITLNGFNDAILTAIYLLNNAYTQNFATQVEVSSEIKQTADSITSTVSAQYETKDHANNQYSQIQQTTNAITQEVSQKVGNDEMVAKLNLAIQDGQGVIDITGNQVTISSDHFTLSADGSVNCTNANVSGTITSNNGTIGGWTVDSDGINNGTLFIRSNGYSTVYTVADIYILQMMLDGTLPKPTSGSAAFRHYDINNDGQITITDLAQLARMLEMEN